MHQNTGSGVTSHEIGESIIIAGLTGRDEWDAWGFYGRRNNYEANVVLIKAWYWLHAMWIQRMEQI